MLQLRETFTLTADVHAVSQKNTTASNKSMNVNAKNKRKPAINRTTNALFVYSGCCNSFMHYQGAVGGRLAGRVQGSERTSAEPFAPPSTYNCNKPTHVP